MSGHAKAGARMSECGQYRYELWRTWSAAPALGFVLLNPSTADAVKNDPTVERCERRARSSGYGGVRIVNLFALRATDPGELYTHPDPVGPDNDAAIEACVRDVQLLICGWGKHGAHLDRATQVLGRLRALGAVPHYLALNRDGSPRHPLYVGYGAQPIAWLHD